MRGFRILFSGLVTAAVALGLAGCHVGEPQGFDAHQCPDIIVSKLPTEGRIEWSKETGTFYAEQRCPTQNDFEKFAQEWEHSHSRQVTQTTTTTTSTTEKTNVNPPLKTGRNANPPLPVESKKDLMKHHEVFHDSENFVFLANQGLLVPGGKYFTKLGTCSLGWTVGDPKQAERVFNLTTGHCGKPGEKVYVEKEGQDPVEIGTFVENKLDPLLDSANYGLIEINPEFYRSITSTPLVTVGGKPLQLAGWVSGDWLKANKPYMCSLDWRSGLSCGNYQELAGSLTVNYDSDSNYRDRGGAVWAFDPDDSAGLTIYAVALTTSGATNPVGTTGGTLIEPIMNQLGLKLFS